MANMLEKTFKNEDLGLELKSYLDKQQKIWFRGRDVAKILGYSKPENAIERHVSKNHKMLQFCCSPETGYQQNDNRGGKTPPQQNDTRGKYCIFIDEAGFYEVVFSRLNSSFSLVNRKFYQTVNVVKISRS